MVLLVGISSSIWSPKADPVRPDQRVNIVKQAGAFLDEYVEVEAQAPNEMISLRFGKSSRHR